MSNPIYLELLSENNILLDIHVDGEKKIQVSLHGKIVELDELVKILERAKKILVGDIFN